MFPSPPSSHTTGRTVPYPAVHEDRSERFVQRSFLRIHGSRPSNTVLVSVMLK
jgi:hypothetical protein